MALLVLSILSSLSDAQSLVELKAAPGFQGHVTLGSWVPLRVIVHNRGSAAVGDLVIPRQPATDGHEYRLAVEVPPSSRRAFTLYLRYRNPVDIAVELRLNAGRRVQVEVPCTPHEYGSRTVLVISRRAGGLSFIGAVPVDPPPGSGPSVQLDSVVAYAGPDSQTGQLGLPDHVAGYSSVSAVVLRDISPSSFRADEQEALESWVASGGLLAILTGPNVAELRDTFVEELAPVQIRGQRTLPHLEALARRFDAVVSLQEALVADTELKPDAQTIAEQDGVPLLVRRPYESGAVYFCAADCAAPPLDSEDRLLLRMWAQILSDRSSADLWAPVAVLSSPVVGGLPAHLVRLPIVEWNSFALFGGFLLAYIVVLVVVVQLVLRKTDRREWTGHVMLLLIVVFSLGALLVGRSVKLAFRRTYETAVAHTRSGSSVAQIDGIVGIRVPNRHEATFRSSEAGRVLEYVCAGQRLSNWPIYQGGGFAALGVPLDLWGIGAFRVEGPLQLGGQVIAEFAAEGQGDPAVTVENHTPYDLECPFVLTAATAHPVNDVPAGETAHLGSVSRKELEGLEPLPVSAIGEVLMNHCHAAEVPGASPQQRIRRRVLRLLESAAEESVSGIGLGSRARPQLGDSELGLPLPSRPLFGAWIELPSGLAELSPAPDARVSQVLLLVEMPLDVSLLSPGNVSFGRVSNPAFDTRASGIWTDYQNNLVVESGSHELTFSLPAPAGRRSASRLGIVLECDQSGLSAEVLNVWTAKWEAIEVNPGQATTTNLNPPDHYVRWPQGWVQVRVSRDRSLETQVSCWLFGELGPPHDDWG